MTTVTLKAGTYWIGDLCYVLDNTWSEVCDRTIDGDDVLEGKFGLADGREFVMFSTAHGDGEYMDQNLLTYPVDSGTIGAILLEQVDTPADAYLGQVHTFERDFQCTTDGQTIQIGSVSIYTGYDDLEDEDDYYEDEEDYLVDEA